MEQLSEGAMALNDDEVFNNCSYSCYVDIADALNRLKEYEDIGTVVEIKKAIDQHMPKKICTACNGSGWYDNCDKYGKSIPCGACDGTGRED